MDEKLQYDINREATIISALNKSISQIRIEKINK